MNRHCLLDNHRKNEDSTFGSPQIWGILKLYLKIDKTQ